MNVVGTFRWSTESEQLLIKAVHLANLRNGVWEWIIFHLNNVQKDALLRVPLYMNRHAHKVVTNHSLRASSCAGQSSDRGQCTQWLSPGISKDICTSLEK